MGTEREGQDVARTNGAARLRNARAIDANASRLDESGGERAGLQKPSAPEPAIYPLARLTHRVGHVRSRYRARAP